MRESAILHRRLSDHPLNIIAQRTCALRQNVHLIRATDELVRFHDTSLCRRIPINVRTRPIKLTNDTAKMEKVSLSKSAAEMNLKSIIVCEINLNIRNKRTSKITKAS